MSYNLKYACLILIISIPIYSCKSDKKELTGEPGHQINISCLDLEELPTLNSNRNNLNISILLDLSDRISPEKNPNPTMDYYLRDIEYINFIKQSLMIHCLNKKTITINDRMQVYFNPPPADSQVNKLTGELKIDLNRSNVSEDKFNQLCSTYEKAIPEIYSLAISSLNFPGSDIWGFFKSNIKTYCIQEDYRNILVILTDGYMYHTNNKVRSGNKTTYLTHRDIVSLKLTGGDWNNVYNSNNYGFIPANKDLNNVEILVLGLNPDNSNPFEEDVLKQYWSDWFLAMGVNADNFDIRTTDLPNNLEESIMNFILKEK